LFLFREGYLVEPDLIQLYSGKARYEKILHTAATCYPYRRFFCSTKFTIFRCSVMSKYPMAIFAVELTEDEIFGSFMPWVVRFS
jgi:hypothetical protein